MTDPYFRTSKQIAALQTAVALCSQKAVLRGPAVVFPPCPVRVLPPDVTTAHDYSEGYTPFHTHAETGTSAVPTEPAAQISIPFSRLSVLTTGVAERMVHPFDTHISVADAVHNVIKDAEKDRTLMEYTLASKQGRWRPVGGGVAAAGSEPEKGGEVYPEHSPCALNYEQVASLPALLKELHRWREADQAWSQEDLETYNTILGLGRSESGTDGFTRSNESAPGGRVDDPIESGTHQPSVESVTNSDPRAGPDAGAKFGHLCPAHTEALIGTFLPTPAAAAWLFSRWAGFRTRERQRSRDWAHQWRSQNTGKRNRKVGAHQHRPSPGGGAGGGPDSRAVEESFVVIAHCYLRVLVKRSLERKMGSAGAGGDGNGRVDEGPVWKPVASALAGVSGIDSDVFAVIDELEEAKAAQYLSVPPGFGQVWAQGGTGAKSGVPYCPNPSLLAVVWSIIVAAGLMEDNEVPTVVSCCAEDKEVARMVDWLVWFLGVKTERGREREVAV